MFNIPDYRVETLKQLAVAMLYALSLYVGDYYFEGEAIVGYFEPASGFALAALLIGGKRYVVGVLLGAVLFNAMSDNSFWAGGIIAVGDTLQTLLGVWLVTREGGFDLRLQSLHSYLRLILLGGCASIAAAALAVHTVLLFSGSLTPENYVHSLLQWWMSDTLGVILVAPLLLVWWRPVIDRYETRRIIDAVLLIGATILAGQVVFLGWLHESIGQVGKGYWMFLPTALIALRLGVRGTVIVLVVLATQGLFGAIQGVGYFAKDIAQTHLANYWFYVATLSVFGMMLSTYFTERKHAEEELRIAAIALESQDGMMVTDARHVILRVNRAFTEISGYSAEEALGQTPHILKSGRHNAAFYAAMWECIRCTGAWKGEIWNRHKNGDIYPEQLSITAVKGVGGEVSHYVAAMHDITERKKAEEEINNLAFFDTLTNLPNRRMLNDRLGQALAVSKRSGLYGALMFLDLDNFKPLNDTYGHSVGDLLLVEVAQRLTGCVREADTVARFGGDEFVVMLGGLDNDKTASAAQAGIVAEKIRLALAEPYWLKFRHEGAAETTVEHRCAASIGVVVFDSESAAEDVLKWADMAMYQAKEGGRNSIRFY